MTKDQISTLIITAAALLYLAVFLYIVVTPFLDALDRGDPLAIGVVIGLALGALVLGARR